MMFGKVIRQIHVEKPRSFFNIFGASVALVLAGSLPTWAGGSISLSEVLEKTKGARSLGQEVSRSLAVSRTAVDDVSCAATRVGRHFEQLGGLRVGPYECPIGGRVLEVRSKVRMFDKDGVELEIGDPRSLRSATSIEEEDFQWEWRESQ